MNKFVSFLQYYLNIYENDTGKSLIDTYGFYGALSFVHYFISSVNNYIYLFGGALAS